MHYTLSQHAGWILVLQMGRKRDTIANKVKVQLPVFLPKVTSCSHCQTNSELSCKMSLKCVGLLQGICCVGS